VYTLISTLHVHSAHRVLHSFPTRRSSDLTGRLIFSFARDNIIPFSSALKKVNPQTQTPIRALATASALGLVFVTWGYISALTGRSEEHTSEPSHLVISYAVFCLKNKIQTD